MQSWDVLRAAIDRIGVKAVAARLKVSTALVYKWCQPQASDDSDGSGARNPLDRIADIVDATDDPEIINWLCNAAGGFYVENPEFNPIEAELELLNTTHRMVQDFGGLLSEVSRSVENDGLILPDEAERIRIAWERLKTQAESFTVACERGHYGKGPIGGADKQSKNS